MVITKNFRKKFRSECNFGLNEMEFIVKDNI